MQMQNDNQVYMHVYNTLFAICVFIWELKYSHWILNHHQGGSTFLGFNCPNENLKIKFESKQPTCECECILAFKTW